MRFQVIRPSSMTDSTGGMGNENGNMNPYLRDAVMTATPEQLQLMLYDGCIRYTLQARDAIEKKDHETSYEKLTRAQQIILEMQNSLNYEVNRDLCERVASIYGFLYRKLIDACVSRDVAAVDDALKILRLERETWQILVDKVNKARHETEGEPSTPAGQPQEAHVSFSAEG